jgi:hypothetical protein
MANIALTKSRTSSCIVPLTLRFKSGFAKQNVDAVNKVPGIWL